VTDVRRGEQLIRTLRLLMLLDRGWVSIGALEEELQYSQRTLKRDIAFLRGHGFEIATRRATVSDSRQVEWKVEHWPAHYDLTKARAVRTVPVDEGKSA
jgi:DeoR/GlpR family transcriptional regulator of sugar metabolism